MSILTKYQQQPTTDSFALIPLSKGLCAIVDPELFDELSRYHWRAVLSGSRFYAIRREFRDGKVHTIRMHRQVAGTMPGYECHHINGNTLDCRRGNLLNLLPDEHHAITGPVAFGC